MKTRLLVFVTLLFCAAIAFAQETKSPDAPASKSPKAVLEKIEYDFGKIKEGVPVSYAFAIKNEGEADLQIESVAPS